MCYHHNPCLCQLYTAAKRAKKDLSSCVGISYYQWAEKYLHFWKSKWNRLRLICVDKMTPQRCLFCIVSSKQFKSFNISCCRWTFLLTGFVSQKVSLKCQVCALYHTYHHNHLYLLYLIDHCLKTITKKHHRFKIVYTTGTCEP